MKIKSICPYSFGANTYLVFSGSRAFVVDPAVSVSSILSAAAEEGATLDGILLTHGHFDHTVAIDTLRRATSVPVYIHENDAIMLTDGKKNGYYDFYGKECVHLPAENTLIDGQVISIGNEQLRVIHTPGHTQGSVCFVCDEFMITGDTLFADTIGRCDLWGGNELQMRDSLKKLRTFDQKLKIFAGHGAPASLGGALDSAAYYI